MDEFKGIKNHPTALRDALRKDRKLLALLKIKNGMNERSHRIL